MPGLRDTVRGCGCGPVWAALLLRSGELLGELGCPLGNAHFPARIDAEYVRSFEPLGRAATLSDAATPGRGVGDRFRDYDRCTTRATTTPTPPGGGTERTTKPSRWPRFHSASGQGSARASPARAARAGAIYRYQTLRCSPSLRTPNGQTRQPARLGGR